MSTVTLLLQIIVVLGVARACAWLLRFIGQPSVVGEMAAGIVLGPVVVGALFPSLHAQVFAKGSLAGLNALSTLGLVLFMFVVGLEMRLPKGGMREQVRSAGLVGDRPGTIGIGVVDRLDRGTRNLRCENTRMI